MTETYAVIPAAEEENGELCIKGRADDLAALQQAVSLMLQIERGNYPIFSTDYGVNLADLMGESYPYAAAELERRISEALLKDERILAVEDFSFTAAANRLSVDFIVKSIYGEAAETVEVKM